MVAMQDWIKAQSTNRAVYFFFNSIMPCSVPWGLERAVMNSQLSTALRQGFGSSLTIDLSPDNEP